MSGAGGRWRTRVSRLGLLTGPLVALAVGVLLPASYVDGAGLPADFSAAGRATLAVLAWMAVWWLTEAIDLPATALLPVVLFPLLGIARIGEAAAPYASGLIFLFMGGFLLALSMQRWGVDRRIALLTLRLVGTRPDRMVGGFMLATAAMSAVVSNTATTAMMLPIALSVIELVRRAPDGPDGAGGSPQPALEDGRFSLCLMLGIAYAASIGGIATIIGTPPNGLLVQFIRSEIAEPFRRDISFVEWLAVGVPLTAVFLPLTWLLLTRVLFPVRIHRIRGGRELLEKSYRQLGALGRGELATLGVFAATAGLWISRPLLVRWSLEIGGEPHRPLAGLSDAGIAMLGGLALFVIPSGERGRFVMEWETARKLPWGILILFGGGLSLASAVQAHGVAEFLGSLVRSLRGAPSLAVVIAVATLMIFLTELTSNTASTATLVPILAGVAVGLDLHPYLLVVPAALAASCAFMMPVATPPNAIVFGSGHVTLPQMARAGLWLNLLGVVLVTLLAYGIVVPLLG